MKQNSWILFFVLVLCVIFASSFAKDSSDNHIREKKRFEKKMLEIRGIRLTVEIADEPEEQAQGLMFRKVLLNREGMLFVYPSSRYLGYWMKNTSISLDLAYFDANRRLIEVHDMEPFSTRIVMSSKKAKYVLETNRGFFREHKIRKGDRFHIFSKKK